MCYQCEQIIISLLELSQVMSYNPPRTSKTTARTVTQSVLNYPKYSQNSYEADQPRTAGNTSHSKSRYVYSDKPNDQKRNLTSTSKYCQQCYKQLSNVSIKEQQIKQLKIRLSQMQKEIHTFQERENEQVLKLKLAYKDKKEDLARVREERNRLEIDIAKIKSQYQRLLDLSIKTTGEYEKKIIQLADKSGQPAQSNITHEFNIHKTKLEALIPLINTQLQAANKVTEYNDSLKHLQQLIQKCKWIHNSLSSTYQIKNNISFSASTSELKKVEQQARKHEEKNISRDKEIKLLKEYVNGLAINLSYILDQMKPKKSVSKTYDKSENHTEEMEVIINALKAISQ